MKGYTNVSVADIKSALENWKDRYNKGGDILELGIDLYYDKFYTKGSWFTKLLNKKKTPEEFVRSKIPMFHTWSHVLSEVIDEDQVELLDNWNYNLHKDAYVAVKALMNASESGDILLDDNLCYFIVKYKGAKNYE